MKRACFLALFIAALVSFSSVSAEESSPYLIGEWFLNDHFKDGSTPIVTQDTQFTFLNPTNLGLNLEYAFFNEDGDFCGCDRDFLQPNGVVRYTMSGEAKGGQFVCTGKVPNPPLATHGSMKTIVFRTAGAGISDALQAGFQVHLLSNGSRTESGLKAVPVTAQTTIEINAIHQQCVTFCDAHQGLCPQVQ